MQAGVRRRLLDGSSSGAEHAGSDLLERGGSTFSLESVDGVHERRGSRSGAVRSIQNFGAAIRRPLAHILNSKARSLVWAGAELGMLAFFANAIMVGRNPSIMTDTSLMAVFFCRTVSICYQAYLTNDARSIPCPCAAIISVCYSGRGLLHV